MSGTDNYIVNSMVRAIDLREHPVKKLKLEVRKKYYRVLEFFVNKHSLSAYTMAQLQRYKNELIGEIQILESDYDEKIPEEHIRFLFNSRFKPWKDKYKYFLISDVALILLEDINKLNIMAEHMKVYMSEKEWTKFKSEIQVFNNEDYNSSKSKIKKAEYIMEQYKKNCQFVKKPFRKFVVTATMSAGKSTLINALVGKNVCRSQNMACTQKIQSVLNKAFDDGSYSKCEDGSIIGLVNEDLWTDNELNSTSESLVGTKFKGGLSEFKIAFEDSPGINYSMDKEHRNVTNKFIEQNNYDFIMYVMNFTQLATEDDDIHLKFVKGKIDKKPIIFLLNKIDNIDSDNEDIFQILENQESYIKSIGFENPVICPVSARAGFLAKKASGFSLSKLEKKEMDNYVDKFQTIGLEKYYEEKFSEIVIEDFDTPEKQLYQFCGLAYVEKIIEQFIEEKEANA